MNLNLNLKFGFGNIGGTSKHCYSGDPFAKKVLAKLKSYARLRVIHGVIYKTSKDEFGQALYIPPNFKVLDAQGNEVSMREQICYKCHDTRLQDIQEGMECTNQSVRTLTGRTCSMT